MALAIQLRSNSEQWRAYDLRQKQEAIIEDNANARRVVQEMIDTTLPPFLSELARKGRRRAYLVGLYAYRPRQWSVDLPRSTALSLEQCCEHLVGVPLHLARWAVAQGLRPYITNFHQVSECERFAWRGRVPTNDGAEGSAGLCVWW